MDDPQIQKSIETIYKFLSVSDKPKKADAIFIATGSSIEQCKKAAELYRQGCSKYIFVVGKRGTFSNPDWTEDEAVIYKKELLRLGVPEEAIHADPIAKNSR